MKNGFRQSMAWLHKYSGLLVGWILFLVFITGTSAYYRHEISLWLRPELHTAAVKAAKLKSNEEEQIKQALNWLNNNAKSNERWTISLPDSRNPLTQVRWQKPKLPNERRAGFEQAWLDPTTGDKIENVRKTRGGDFFYRMHFDLHYISPLTARWIIGFCAMFMFVAIISGIITHKRIFKDFFTFRPKKGQRSWLDAHNLVAVLPLPYHIMITYTGLLTLMLLYMPWSASYIYQEKGMSEYTKQIFSDNAPVIPKSEIKNSAPNIPMVDIIPMIKLAKEKWQDEVKNINISNANTENAIISISRNGNYNLQLRQPRMFFSGASGQLLSETNKPKTALLTYNVLEGLHTARFSDSLFRFLFFISGILGCIMVASGLILWSVKTRTANIAATKKGQKISELPLKIVDSLNIAAIGGLLIAIPSFFWINRLMPYIYNNPENAPQLEINLFFIIWVICAIVSIFYSNKKAWISFFSLAGFLFTGIFLLNPLTGGAGLFSTIAAGQFIIAGFDIICAIIGLSLFSCVFFIKKHKTK